MFLLTVFIYPGVLALLLIGAGLLVDRAAGGTLPGALVAVAGAAALIAVSQLATDIAGLAPATPYLLPALALAGLILGRARLRACSRRLIWPAGITALAYLLGIAPVLLAGRPSFSAYMVLTDSAVHLVGASYLVAHGQFFSHLELHNSYGQVVNSYFNSGYPSGSDTLFGGSALLLRLPLIWAFQPFNALMLALAAGPAWLLARRAGLREGTAALAALTVTLPALVYAYELIASVKEIVALPMILALGALIVEHRRWLTGSPRGAIPFAVVLAAGVSALGVGFGAWVAGSAAVLALIALGALRARRLAPLRVAALAGVLAAVAIVCAWPTWGHLEASFQVTNAIATTTNAGNLQSPLQAVQVLGVWLSGSYLTPPTGVGATLTDVLMGLVALAAALGVADLLRSRRWALAGWLGAMLVVALGVGLYGTTWVDAKVLVLTGPVVALCAWAGVGALRRSGRLRVAAPLLAMVIVGGVLASDAIQYHATDLAPTARYEEMAALSRRFAGRGPTLFADFDEYSMYQMRSLNVGGPDFLYPPATVRSASKGHGYMVSLDRLAPKVLSAYPLIVTRRDPAVARPPSAYRLVWRGTYYEVWARSRSSARAIAVAGVATNHPPRCARVAALARLARQSGGYLVADTHPHLIKVDLASAARPAGWTVHGPELVMGTAGSLRAHFTVSHGGLFDLWLQGEAMPGLSVRVDGRLLGDAAGQLSGNGDSPDSMVPMRVRLAAGHHVLTIAREGFSLAAGNGGQAYLDAVLLTPLRPGAGQRLLRVHAAQWRSLCHRILDWIEVVPRTHARLIDRRRSRPGGAARRT